MKPPHVSIADFMMVVALFAIDWWAIVNIKQIENVAIILVLIGWLPMANILSLGLLFRPRRHGQFSGSRSFLVGFEVLGATVSLCFVALSLVFPHANMILLSRVVPGASRLVRLMWMGMGWTVEEIGTMTLVIAFYMLPQVAIAVIGGLVHRSDERRLSRSISEVSP